ncbi:MAG: Uma2 family endonuclease [Bacteroidetes bacterium]|nr:MAG: Uma2 family endonuclease [Bacteroidota bacterium]
MNDIIHFPMEFTPTDFHNFWEANKDLPYSFNLIQANQILLTPKTKASISFVEELGFDFGIWNSADDAGKVISSDHGFLLPDGKILSVDVAWVNKKVWKRIAKQTYENHEPVIPNFLIVVIPNAQNLKIHQENMFAWTWHGTQLAWLIELESEKVYIYRADGKNEELSGFDQILSADELIDDLEIDLAEIKERAAETE